MRNRDGFFFMGYINFRDVIEYTYIIYVTSYNICIRDWSRGLGRIQEGKIFLFFESEIVG